MSARGELFFDRVGKRFQSGRVLRDLSLRCRAGEVVVVLGPSGCGKSTLLGLAAGTTPPDEGTVSLDGVAVGAPGPERAVVFQDHGLFPWSTASENVAIGLRFAGIGKAERQARAQAALEAVQLGDAGAKLVHELSGGMRQRVAIARALVLQSPVLLLDEPFSALDARTRTSLHDHLDDLWSKARTTVLLVTHSLEEAVRLGHRLVVLGKNAAGIRKEIVLERHAPHFDRHEIARVRAELEAATRDDHDEDDEDAPRLGDPPPRVGARVP